MKLTKLHIRPPFTVFELKLKDSTLCNDFILVC